MAVTLTTPAAERVKHYLSERRGGLGLRLGVKTTGCSGFAYVVDLADSIEPGDQVYESNDVKVIVSRESLPYVDGTEIDFSGDRLSKRFTFRNPNEKNQCGCGESFGV